MTVYAGNQRVRAAKDLGWTKVPCIIDDELDAETMRFRVVADNAHFGENDWDVLSSDYSIEELFNAGYTESELGIGISLGDDPEKKEKKNKICPHCGESL